MTSFEEALKLANTTGLSFDLCRRALAWRDRAKQLEEEWDKRKVEISKSLESLNDRVADWERLSAAREAELARAIREAECPHCQKGVADGEPCHKCMGTGSVTIAYDTSRIYVKLLEDKVVNLQKELDDAKDTIENERYSAHEKFINEHAAHIATAKRLVDSERIRHEEKEILLEELAANAKLLYRTEATKTKVKRKR